MYHACKAGMDMGIVNAAQVEEDVYENIDKELLEYIEDVLLNRRRTRRRECLHFAADVGSKIRAMRASPNRSRAGRAKIRSRSETKLFQGKQDCSARSEDVTAGAEV